MKTLEAGATLVIKKTGKSFRIEKTDRKARLSPLSVRAINERGEAEGDLLGMTWKTLDELFGRGGYAVK